MNTKVSREEYKYFINKDELLYLRSSLSKVMKVDENSNIENQYTVTSLYFDTPLFDNLEEKLSGIWNREKFRIRIYNNDTSLIKFESKQRVDTAIKKTSQELSLEDSKEIICKKYQSFLHYKNQFLEETYVKFKSRGYRPSSVVEYDREAYFLPYGNIRITLDMNLRTYNSNFDIFNLKNPAIPVFNDNLQILEVKFNTQLPQHLKMILSKTRGKRCAISKFVYGQKFVDASPTRDWIRSPF